MDPAEDEFAPSLEWPGSDEAIERPHPRLEDAIDPADAEGDEPDAEPSAAEEQPPVAAAPSPLLPALAGRLENTHSALVTLATRIDGLAVATTSLRSMLADRLAEYAEMMAQVGRSQADTIEEYRHGAERAVGELRRAVTGNDEFFRKFGGRFDELLAETRTVTDLVRESTSGSAEASVKRLGVQVAKGFEELGGRVDELLSDSEAVTELIRTTAAPSAEASIKRLSAQLSRGLDELGGRVDELLSQESVASGEPVGEQVLASLNELSTELNASNAALHDEIRWLQQNPPDRSADGEPGSTAGTGEVIASIREMSEQLAGIEAAVSRQHHGADIEVGDELRLLRDEVQQLKRRIGVRARAPINLEEDQLQTIADAVQAKLGSAVIDDREFDRIVDAIVKRLESMLEVVPGDVPPKRASARSSGEKPRSRGTQ